MSEAGRLKSILAVTGLCVFAAGSAAAITSEKFLYSKERTGYLHLDPAGFSLDSNRDSGYEFDKGAGNLVGIGFNLCFSDGVRLPNRAIIERIEVTFSGTSAAHPSSIGVHANEPISGIYAVATGEFSDASGGRRTVSLKPDRFLQTVNNAKYAYSITVCIPGARRTTFHGARIQYAYESAGD